jgi:hypothetical protein
VPPPVTDKVTFVTGAVNDAETLVVALIVKLQPPVPAHAPPQPPNVEPPVGVALSDIPEPEGKLALQVPLALPALTVQLIPLPVTVPWPVPPPVTDSVLFVTGVPVTQI